MSRPAAVRLVAPEDLEAVAQLHREVFPDYDSSGLGARYCRRMLRAYAHHPEAWVVVATTAEVVGPVGYLVAAPPTVQRAVNRSLRPWAAVAGLRSPVRLVRRALDRARPAPPVAPSPPVIETAVAAEADEWTPTIRVVLIGVAPPARGTGAGGALLDDFAARAAAAGHRRADLSVAIDNAAARGAYARRGWVEAGEEAGVAVRCRLDLAG